MVRGVIVRYRDRWYDTGNDKGVQKPMAWFRE